MTMWVMNRGESARGLLISLLVIDGFLFGPKGAREARGEVEEMPMVIVCKGAEGEEIELEGGEAEVDYERNSFAKR